MYCSDATTGGKTKIKRFKIPIGFATHMKWREVYFDIMSAVGHTLQGLLSVSKSLHTCFFPKPTIKSTDKSGLQVRVNFGLGEGDVLNCSDTDIDASEEGSLRISFIKFFT